MVDSRIEPRTKDDRRTRTPLNGSNNGLCFGRHFAVNLLVHFLVENGRVHQPPAFVKERVELVGHTPGIAVRVKPFLKVEPLLYQSVYLIFYRLDRIVLYLGQLYVCFGGKVVDAARELRVVVRVVVHDRGFQVFVAGPVP